jgi:hypothetical protein
VERGVDTGGFGWASSVLTALAVGCLVLAGFTLWRWRRRWYLALPCVLTALAAAPLGWFVGAMAIADDWI